ncbi:MAG: efflux RND transporter permease subunit [Bacteroidetes bacterium]|nr:efflux RND transporter permease subunit [Bacteroidota bacterium]
MLEKLIDFSLRRRFVALSLTALVAIGGVASLLRLPINSLPDVTPVQVLVITKAGRYSPYDVERLVSFPIEAVMNGLPNVTEVRSISQFGLSAVTVEFDEKTDIYFARQLVAQRVQSVAGGLPEGVDAPQLGPISTALGEIYQYTVDGDGYSLTDLRTINDWLVAPQLKTVPGVTEITSFGGFVKQYEVLPDPDRMRQLGIGLSEILAAIPENNGVAGGNYLEHNREQYIIRGIGLIRNEEDLGRIVVGHRGERPVYLKDVAMVRIGQGLRQGAVTKDGAGEVVTGIVMMLRGGNGREVIAAVEEKLVEVNRGLPEGVTVRKFYDQSDLIERTTATIEENLVVGGFLVIAVLLALLGELTGALIVASVIPLSMLFAFIGMREFGLAANLMSLGAIDFGMVVDGAVVMVDNMVRGLRHEQEKPPESRRDRRIVLREAGAEVVRPIFFGVLIILMVYVPIATFSGIEGLLFRPMAITVATAVFGSLLLALVYVPAMASIVFRNGVKTRKNRVMEWLKPRYREGLANHIDKRGLVVSSALVVFVLSLILMARMGTEFLPELDEGSILIEEVRMPSVTLGESIENANWLAGEIMTRVPEVETVVPKTGRSDLANDWMGVHQTDVWVLLKPRSEWRPGVSKKDIQDEIEPLLHTEPGLAYNFTQPIAMRVDELTSGVKSDLAVKVFGEDLDVLGRVGNDIASLLPSLPGTDNFFVEQTVGQPYLTIAIDRAAVAAYGLNVSDVQSTIEAGLGGQVVSEVYEGQRRIDIVVRFPESERSDFAAIMATPVTIPSGDTVPMSELAAIVAEEGPREVARENGWRRVIVGINLDGIDIGSYVSNLQDALDTRLEIPPGVFIEYGGSFEDQQRATRHLMIVVPIALAIIFGLLYLMFGEGRYAVLVFMNLPLALSGGVILLWLRGLYLSVSASIGFVALFGVAVLNGIVLIEHLNHLRREGWSVRDAVLTGAADRLRPVLMTALVASLGFVPMAFNTGPGSEVQRPLATVVIGGLVTATLLTLLVLPVIYLWMENGRPAPEGPETDHQVRNTESS